ncbi:M3 family oligoendopeptidase [Paenibacillus sp. HWE-109]|uniref:M3 family oligoendopeptidase n=1 Tax=Paenibacillus sp. HWE-109 TaxID=1306526 RepID=UPI001EDFFC9E|nr:M3 family oligoendopeptidase [Paenibacillus sp. HWE-109]UKS31394.1 M3 family oligoendopeptidase [Paenibacillus sp. HWE-109]
MHVPLNQTWDLESFFPGGSESPAFAAHLKELQASIASFQEQVLATPSPQKAADSDSLAKLVDLLQHNLTHILEADSFVGCLLADNQKDKKAPVLSGQVKSLFAEHLSSLTRFDQVLTGIPDEVWSEILRQEPFAAIAFSLEERRALAQEKLPPEQEALINDLAVDGYHGWGDLYNSTVGQFRMPVEVEGEQVELSAGQAFNKLHTENREERLALFEKWEKAWTDKEDYCAEALNHLAGFRLQVYKYRGWKSIHKEPLAINRMKEKTLNVMWEVIDRNKGIFVDYLNRKAKLLGVEKLAWVDVDAPLGDSSKKISYDEGASLIIEQFERFSPKLAAFSTAAFEQRWIEAEDRAGKRPGGFCTSFPVAGETRIFMTYGGTLNNVSTLAHELGHGYHQHVMTDMPALAQEYAMNVAETASTFAEMIVADAVVKSASTDEERIILLEDKIQRAIAFFMNIHARFIFETNFYAERSQGLVSVERLNELMVDAQKLAYKDALSSYHPHFWAAKLHFYATDVPFYNFPYTFGYMFSAGIYARAAQEGAAFEDKYISLLRDTGSMNVEELAHKHLGVDLTEPDFWQSAVDMAAQDVKQFMALTESKING